MRYLSTDARARVLAQEKAWQDRRVWQRKSAELQPRSVDSEMFDARLQWWGSLIERAARESSSVAVTLADVNEFFAYEGAPPACGEKVLLALIGSEAASTLRELLHTRTRKDLCAALGASEQPSRSSSETSTMALPMRGVAEAASKLWNIGSMFSRLVLGPSDDEVAASEGNSSMFEDDHADSQNQSGSSFWFRQGKASTADRLVSDEVVVLRRRLREVGDAVVGAVSGFGCVRARDLPLWLAELGGEAARHAAHLTREEIVALICELENDGRAKLAPTKDGTVLVKFVAHAECAAVSETDERVAVVLGTLLHIHERVTMLHEQAAEEKRRGIEAIQRKSRVAARMCIARRRMLDAQAERIAARARPLEELRAALDEAVLNQTIIKALAAGGKALAGINRQMSLEDIEAVADAAQEALDEAADINNAVQDAMGAGAEEIMDEAELDDELAALEAEVAHDAVAHESAYAAASSPHAPVDTVSSPRPLDIESSPTVARIPSQADTVPTPGERAFASPIARDASEDRARREPAFA